MLLACIGIALVFWLLLKLSKSFETEKIFHIRYSIPDGKTFVDTPPRAVSVTIKGIGWDLISNFVNARTPDIVFDLNEAVAVTLNRTELLNRVNELLSSGNIAVTNINLDYIRIELEDESTKKVPVSLVYELDFAEEFHLKAPLEYQPDSVVLTGPASKLAEIDSWPTEKVVLENIHSNITKTIALRSTMDEQIRLSTTSVQILLEVERFTQKTLFLPILVKNAPDSINIFPPNVKLSCVVGLSRFDELEPSDFQVEVNMKGIKTKAANNTLPIQLTSSPDFVKNITFSPKSVEFFIVKQ